eukprot:m51a1_g13809 hypothetical protein (134) ;mRNA; r:396819-397397
MAFHGPNYGLSKEVEDKINGRYDPQLERECVQWVEANSGEKCTGTAHEYLKTGVVLCKAMNAFRPGWCKFSTSTMPFKIMENINSFLEACRRCGVNTVDLFQTVDLYEAKNMTAVILCLTAVRRYLGDKPSTA